MFSAAHKTAKRRFQRANDARLPVPTVLRWCWYYKFDPKSCQAKTEAGIIVMEFFKYFGIILFGMRAVLLGALKYCFDR